jgi:hypothetical protein
MRRGEAPDLRVGLFLHFQVLIDALESEVHAAQRLRKAAARVQAIPGGLGLLPGQLSAEEPTLDLLQGSLELLLGLIEKVGLQPVDHAGPRHVGTHDS